MDTFTIPERIAAIRAAKLEQTREKQAVIGAMDFDDHALILPPPEAREVVQTISGSGMPITDVRIKGFTPRSNHPSGGFFGPQAVGANFRSLLEAHPAYVDPNSALLGGYMVNFGSYIKLGWNPDFDFSFLKEDIQKYKLSPGIGARQHFCQDLAIGLELGWGGILEKIHHYRQLHPESAAFYEGLEDVVLGLQNWIGRTAQAARRLAGETADPRVRQNLLAMAAMNERLVTAAPRSFREALQWMLWYQITARMFNGSGSLGRLDVLLQPYYERETAAGALTEAEATFEIACLLVRDTGYLQLGGPDAQGRDVTTRLSYLVLEAAHWLKIPVNVGVSVGEAVDPGLLRRGVEILFADKAGVPKFLGVEQTAQGFARNNYPVELGRQRAYSGCHWSAIPGREYTLNDCVKINFAAVFEYSFNELLTSGQAPSIALLWERFAYHLQQAVDATARCIDFHLEHMQDVIPELVLDLLCSGPIERGLDASHGGVEFYNLGIDGAALATVADSFAVIEQRVEKEGRLSWLELKAHLDSNWSGPQGEKARLMLRSVPRFGQGGSRADEYARRITAEFTRLVKRQPTPRGFNLIPGLFSWANTIPMGKVVGATPNGRRAGAPISHGANPDPGFRADGAPTALAVAIAAVQPGYGNTAPMQIELDPLITREEEGVDCIASLIRSHFQLGGTQINLNIMDAARVLAAHQDPSLYPDLVVRVTGFSAFFASLSPEFRQLVVDRMIQERV
jgi:formate C-acetyltransferase